MSTSLLRYTEAALALLDGKLVDILYLPPDVRKSKIRINAAGHATAAPPSPKEQLDRIVLADPLGFLIAVMNGQPVLTFVAVPKKLEEEKPKKLGRGRPPKPKVKNPALKLGEIDGMEIIGEVLAPTIDDRIEVAKFLLPYVTEKRLKKAKDEKGGEAEDEFEVLLSQRIQQAKDGETEG